MKEPKRSVASLRRDIYHALAATLQGDLDNGSGWIGEEQDGTESSEAVTAQREDVVRLMLLEFRRKSEVPQKTAKHVRDWLRRKSALPRRSGR